MDEFKKKIIKMSDKDLKEEDVPNWLEGGVGIVIFIVFSGILAPIGAWVVPVYLIFGEKEFSYSDFATGVEHYNRTLPPPWGPIAYLMGFCTLYLYYRLLKNYGSYSKKQRWALHLLFILTFFSAIGGTGIKF